MCNLKMTIPKTLYKKGETLRLTMEGWGKMNGVTGSRWVAIGHDPANRVDTTFGTTNITSSILYLPTQVDI
jgi:hypothetical protein